MIPRRLSESINGLGPLRCMPRGGPLMYPARLLIWEGTSARSTCVFRWRLGMQKGREWKETELTTWNISFQVSSNAYARVGRTIPEERVQRFLVRGKAGHTPYLKMSLKFVDVRVSVMIILREREIKSGAKDGSR